MTRAAQRTLLALVGEEIERATFAAKSYQRFPWMSAKIGLRHASRATRLQLLAQRLRRAWGMEIT